MNSKPGRNQHFIFHKKLLITANVERIPNKKYQNEEFCRQLGLSFDY